jgi:shikimate dehydrogenase
MRPDVEASPVPDEWLRPGAWVYDLVYNPAETRLLRAARARGCTPLGGAEMFLAQAMRQQQVWFGAPPDEEVMRRVLDEALQARDAAAAAAGDGHGR